MSIATFTASRHLVKNVISQIVQDTITVSGSSMDYRFAVSNDQGERSLCVPFAISFLSSWNCLRLSIELPLFSDKLVFGQESVLDDNSVPETSSARTVNLIGLLKRSFLNSPSILDSPVLAGPELV